MHIREMTIDDYDDLIRLLTGTPGVTVRDADSYQATARYLARNPGLSFVAQLQDPAQPHPLSPVEGSSIESITPQSRSLSLSKQQPAGDILPSRDKLGERVHGTFAEPAEGNPIEGSSIVGCIMSGHDGRRGYLQHLVVLPAYRRQGIGAALVNACLAALDREGITKTHIFVFADNTPGNAFWRAQGWVPRDEINMYSYITSGSENA